MMASLHTCIHIHGQAIGLQLGNADFFGIMEADPVGAVLWFFPFVFMQIFVFGNMVIAIILDGYMGMKAQHNSHLSRLECLP